VLFLTILFPVMAQEDFYAPETIRQINIHFREPNWRQILDSLFETSGDDGKLTGDVTIDGQVYRNAGIRYKGYSSYNADEVKNPFNIDLDYTHNNQNHLGHVKIKLSNVIHDPSFVREVLSYEIARKYLPASRANFANLYVNDTLIGLYTNVEAVDSKFTDEHWGSHTNSFFKGEPVKLQYPFGQNANLALTHGADSSGYTAYYKMESATGWNNLYELIYRLDQGADSVNKMLNIDRTLWMHAFNEVMLNLDSYIGYAQNYYLYQDDNGQFNPILWDLNMSFGSFRDSDGSKNFQGVTIPEVKQTDPLALMTFAVSPRPLMTRLFCNDTLRKIYFAHMRTIVEENIRNGWYFNRAKQLQDQIDAAVLTDTNRFYSYNDFHANLSVTVGGTGSMKEYPGLKDLMESRVAFLDSLEGFSGQPVISEVTHTPEAPAKNEPVWITARIQGAGMAMLGYRYSTGAIFSKTALADDGNHHDGVAGDGIYGTSVISAGHTLQYYLYAENDSAGVLSPERAEYEFHTIQPMILPGDIVLNEFEAGTDGGDWVELLNTTREPMNMTGIQLSADPALASKTVLIDTVIPSHGYLVVDLSGNSNVRANPLRVTLAKNGGNIRLFNSYGLQLDSVFYGTQPHGKSTGRYPNGYGAMTCMMPTKGSNNLMGTTPETGFLLYPNPASGVTNIEFANTAGTVTVTIFNGTGKPVMENTYFYGTYQIAAKVQPVDISQLPGGVYILRVCGNEGINIKKLIIY
jgi:hypothetical protein